MLTMTILLKGLAVAIVVGFVTASIKSWVDRVFLVIMLVGIVGLPIADAIVINIAVVSLAALLMVIRQRKVFGAVPAFKAEWLLIVVPALAGGVAGRFLASDLEPKVLLAILGVYAVLVGLRILFIKPMPERESKAHVALLSPIGLLSGFLAGLISAGGKPFTIPAYNNAMGHHPRRAYAFGSLGVVVAAWAALATQFAFIATPSGSSLILALYEFVLVTFVALIVNRFWSERLNKVVNYIIAPILVIVGVRFFIMALA